MNKKIVVEPPKLESPIQWFEFKAEMESYLQKICGVNKVLLRYVIRDDFEDASFRVISSGWDTFMRTGACHSGVQYEVDNTAIFEFLRTAISH